ncbi:MBL fold metallo-hydrolase [Spongisporangium articulatum]|uniref:MBL fold metallo-hydrolase n=1 Tax=Spongisporangium articulatum TaxID=3362603 RepID=A0ABW8AQ56_9ACTN
MLKQVADGVSVHVSEFMLSNAVVVQGRDGVLLIDAGVTGDELAHLADDLAGAGHVVAAGFSTHPHWDHLLWHERLGTAPRYGTAHCAATVRAKLPDAAARARVTGMLPPELVGRVPLDDLLGAVTGLPADATRIPWDGPEVRIIEHQAHAAGHAALLIPDAGALVVGDLLSDVLVPMLDAAATDPVGDYLTGLAALDAVADDVDVFVPGHGTVGDAAELRVRLDRDRAYVDALRGGGPFDDPRIDARARAGWEWVAGLHAGQLSRLSG